MRVFAAIFSFILGASICCSCYAITFLPKREIGRDYSLVRKDLLRKGDKPVSQVKVQNCGTVLGVCAMYPEVRACPIGAMGQPVQCLFEWKSNTGQRFGIVNIGEDVNKLPVEGMNVPPESAVKSGFIE